MGGTLNCGSDQFGSAAFLMLMLALGSLGLAIAALLSAPTSAAQLQPNLVDTWQASATGSLALSLLLSVCLLGSLLGRWLDSRRARSWSVSAVSLTLAIGILLVAVERQTRHAEQLLGIELSWF